MTRLDRYIARHVVQGTLVWLIALVALFSFIAFIDDVDNVGRGDYTTVMALEYMLLTMPGLTFELFPLAALIGALMGLGTLSSSSELTVIRSSGVSVRRICAAVMAGAAGLIVIAVCIGELIAPTAEQFAQARRSLALTDALTLNTRSGFWIRDGNSFINIRRVLENNEMREVSIYEFDAENRLRVATRADKARHENDKWQLDGIVQSHLADDGVQVRRIPAAVWDSLFDPELVSVVAVDPEMLSIIGLRRYIGYLGKNGLDTARFEFALWHKFIYPLATGVMILLAVPLVLGRLKSSGLGQRIVVGVIVGISFHVISQAAGQFGLVYGLSAAISATMPSALFAIAAMWMLSRIR
ncbi:MAG: lipopolysaccharide export system permease protein [Gammaproteobacteria bacterium]|jgi:lipopolysaccharide export system permease protein